MLPEIREIGYISKTHGFKGDLLLNVYDGFELDIDTGDFIFIIDNEKPVPYFITKMGEHKAGYIIRFETNCTEEKAKQLVGSVVHIEIDKVALEEDFVDYSILIGFDVMDKTKGHIGAITDVIDNGPNVVIQVDSDGKEIMLPYNEDLVIDINEETKVLNYDAPEGLIDMYLE